MQDLTGKRVLVTGGAAGIGRALAERFAAEGAHLVLTDIDEPALLATEAALRERGGEARGYRLDVTDGDGILRVRDAIHRDGGPIDVLVNNAGVVFGGSFLDVPLSRHELTYRVNVLGLVAMTHGFLPDLLARPDAHLVNIASAAGLIGLPYGSTYASSKWAVIGFSESVRLEASMTPGNHLHVTTVCPSYVSTGLFDGAKPPLLTRMLTADRLADKVVRAVLRNRPFVRTPWLVKVTPMMKALLPAGVSDAVAWSFGATSSMVQWKGRGAAAPSRPEQPPQAKT